LYFIETNNILNKYVIPKFESVVGVTAQDTSNSIYTGI